MKKLFFIPAIVFLIGVFVNIGFASEQKSSKGVTVQVGAQYNPAIKYAGDYRSDLLFFKPNAGKYWRRIPRFDRLKYVTCSDTTAALQKEGIWEGHLRLKDGSCSSSDEPSSWALGNRLNFDEQINQLESN